MLTSIRGVRLNVQDRGDGPAVVFLHGIGCSIATWAPQIAGFGGRCRTVAIDSRGFGASDRTYGDMTMADYADDVIGVLDALDITDATIVGLSMGGMMAQHIALRAPEKVKSLVLADTTGSAAGSTADTLAATNQAVLEFGMGPVVANFLAASFAPATFASNSPCLGILQETLATSDPLSYRLAANAIIGHNTLDRLRDLDIPATVVVGDQDALLPLEHSEALADAIPGAKLVVIDGAGHMSNLEQPEQFDAVLSEVLAQ